MVNKQTINFNCGQLKQLIVKTINFLEALEVILYLNIIRTNKNHLRRQYMKDGSW